MISHFLQRVLYHHHNPYYNSCSLINQLLLVMTTSPPIQDDEQDEEFKLKQIIKEQNLIPQINNHNHEDGASEQQQQQFNQLSKDKKMNRLNKLIEKSQIYSQIIADNILQTSLERKEEQNNVAPPAPVPAKSDSKNELDTQPIKKKEN